VLECRAFPAVLQGLGNSVVAKTLLCPVRVLRPSPVGIFAYNLSGLVCFFQIKNSSATAQSPHDYACYSSPIACVWNADRPSPNWKAAPRRKAIKEAVLYSVGFYRMMSVRHLNLHYFAFLACQKSSICILMRRRRCLGPHACTILQSKFKKSAKNAFKCR
jgi:hypothetical protein